MSDDPNVAAKKELLMLILKATNAFEDTNQQCGHHRLADATEIPRAFHDVSKAIPLIQRTLSSVKSSVEEASMDQGQDYCQIKEVITDISKKAVQLEHIFERVLPDSKEPRLDRYRAATNNGSGGDQRVEVLMQSVLDSLIQSTALRNVVSEHMRDLQTTSTELSNTPRSLLEGDSRPGIHNHGSGHQILHLGSGHQNINNSPAPQFIGTFSGGFGNIPGMGSNAS
ncbi:hypothetical protein QBC35DRAFT_500354 [Podospora australis]|uniref:NACHT-NTPase and P-loop NTPases N-terminal domain-containing protein n=1 Tax=Podospora australis TaxID=1536484 RepID=A0AAN7AIE6_9PEZI|nr:hypothetical protein QBC35DRAFT_500354 [Podospora australis]